MFLRYRGGVFFFLFEVQEWQFLTSGIGLPHLIQSFQEIAPKHAWPISNPACTGHHPSWLLVLKIAITILVSAFGFILLEDSRCHQIDVLICVPCDKECENVWLRVGNLRIDLLSSFLLGTTRTPCAGPRSIAAMFFAPFVCELLWIQSGENVGDGSEYISYCNRTSTCRRNTALHKFIVCLAVCSKFWIVWHPKRRRLSIYKSHMHLQSKCYT